MSCHLNQADGTKLIKDFRERGITPRGLLELSALAKQVDKQKFGEVKRLISLQKLVAYWLDRHLDKGDTRVSDWEAELSLQQRIYAANDVSAALQVYRRMLAVAEANQVSTDLDLCLHDSHWKFDNSGKRVWKARSQKAGSKGRPRSRRAGSIAVMAGL